MTFTEFLSILNGTWIEVAGTSAKNQCVDLANAYIKYCLGLPIIEWANAVDFPSKAGDKYDYILNTPTGVPVEGDLVIWGGTYGHIAIFIEGDTNRFISFDQNYPTVGTNCHVQEHNYNNVLGWLHSKVQPQDQQTLIDELRADRDKNWQLYQQALQRVIDMETIVQGKDKTITTLTRENLEVKDASKILVDQHTADLGTIQGLTNDKKTLDEQITKLHSDLATITTNLHACQIEQKNLSYATNKQLLAELLKRLTGRK